MAKGIAVRCSRGFSIGGCTLSQLQNGLSDKIRRLRILAFLLMGNETTAVLGMDVAGLTPVMRQYRAAKDAHPDALVFFRLGISTSCSLRMRLRLRGSCSLR